MFVLNDLMVQTMLLITYDSPAAGHSQLLYLIIKIQWLSNAGRHCKC